MTERSTFFDTKIEYLKGVGPQRATLLNKELNIFTYGDLLQHYPFRHEDRSQFHRISELNELLPGAQIKGRLKDWTITGEGHKKRLVATFTDGTGVLELVWFQGIAWFEKILRRNADYIVYGKPTFFGGRYSITHPDIDPLTPENAQGGTWQPIYPLTEKLRKRFVDSRAISRMIKTLLELATPHIRETLPESLISQYRLISKADALWSIHLPPTQAHLQQATRRLKFEELFYNQLRLIKSKILQQNEFPGQVFSKTHLLKEFYEHHLPFEIGRAHV